MTLFAEMLWTQTSARLTRRLAAVLVLLLLVWVLVSPTLVSAYAGLGDYISEKLLGGAGATDASLYLGDSANGPTVLGSGPAITTNAVTDAIITSGGTIATLRGALTDLNGMPQADVWFVWGYDPSAMVNTTPVITVFAIGDQTAAIAGYNSEQEVYCQLRAGTDGTSRGAVQSFRVEGGTGGWLLWNILTLVIAMGMFILILRFSGNLIVALVGTIIGILAIAIVRSIL